MRMEPAGRPHKWNTFQQRLGRLRPDFNVISWHTTRTDPRANIPTANVLAKLSPWHFEMNTTRGLTPGLLVPELGEDGGRVPLPNLEDSRGFGREFLRRQTTIAGPAQAGPVQAGSAQTAPAQTGVAQTAPAQTGAAQTTRKRARRARPRTQAASPSPDSQDNDLAEDGFDEEYEQPIQRRQRHAPRASQVQILPSSEPVPSSANTQQLFPQASYLSMGNTPNQYQQAAQLSMSNPPNQYQQFAGPIPSPYLALQPTGTASVRRPIRPMTTTQLLGRRSTDSTNMIRFSVIDHNERQQPYHPFTRMDIRNTQRVRPPLLPHLSAGPQTAPPTGSTQREPTLRHFGTPGPSPFLTQPPPEEDVGGEEDDKQGYVDPFLERFYKQYIPSVPSGYFNSMHQTRLTLVQRLQILGGRELLLAEAAAKALQIQMAARNLRASHSITQPRKRQECRERDLSKDMPPSLDIRGRMAEAQVRLREADTFRTCSAHDFPHTHPFTTLRPRAPKEPPRCFADKRYRKLRSATLWLASHSEQDIEIFRWGMEIRKFSTRS